MSGLFRTGGGKSIRGPVFADEFPVALLATNRHNPRPFHPGLSPIMDRSIHPSLGIAAISVYQPGWQLGNAWFGGTMPRKFAHHTGIETRAISLDDEATMGLRAVRQLQQETRCNLADCRGIVFVSPSFIPPSVARRYLDAEQSVRERPSHAARQLAARLGLQRARAVGINWFCCGYARALSLASRRWAPRLGLRRDEFLLVVVASRISRITDYACGQTAGLFGDMASATMVVPVQNRRHPVHFEIVHAVAEKQPVERPAFDFHVRDHVPVPTPDGGTVHTDHRIVYSLDGMAIADIAPRAMSAAVVEALRAAGLSGDAVRFVVPHQAGSGIVRFTGMKLEEYGIGGELINGLTRHTGNVSACSIPHALRETWRQLSGVIACPNAAVGSPGKAEVLQGCILLRSTAYHDRQTTAAA